MQVLTKGRALPQGKFPLHSRFAQVLNFKGEGQSLVSLVTPKIGGGPGRLVLKDFSWLSTEAEPLLVLDQVTEELRVLSSCGEKILFRSSLQNIPWGCSYLPKLDLENLRLRLPFLEAFLVREAPAKSLFFLVDESRVANFQSSFEKAWVESMKLAFSPLGKSSLGDVLLSFKGQGMGLTPSGDDFNLGLLTALSLQEATYADFFVLARGENIFVNSFLAELKQGLISEKTSHFLQAFEKSEDELQKATFDFLTQGETSGADWLFGFITGFNLGRIYAN